jgi:hypothetical protein
MTTEVLRSMLYRGSEITREAALVVRHSVVTKMSPHAALTPLAP